MLRNLFVLISVFSTFNQSVFAMGWAPEDKKVKCELLLKDLKSEIAHRKPEYRPLFQKVKDVANTYRWIIGKLKENFDDDMLNYSDALEFIEGKKENT